MIDSLILQSSIDSIHLCFREVLFFLWALSFKFCAHLGELYYSNLPYLILCLSCEFFWKCTVRSNLSLSEFPCFWNQNKMYIFLCQLPFWFRLDFSDSWIDISLNISPVICSSNNLVTIKDAICSLCQMKQGPYFCRDDKCFEYFCR